MGKRRKKCQGVESPNIDEFLKTQKEKYMGGLAKMCKLYGSIDVADENGKKVKWVYDYAKDKPVLNKDMTKEERRESEKAKYTSMK